MADDPGQYESAITRVGGGSGRRWPMAWIAVVALVVTVGVGGTLLAAPAADPIVAAIDRSPDPVAADADASTPPARGPTRAAPPPLDITSGASGYAAAFEARRRRSVPLIIESTDFHANGGAAYYGIGGKLLRALAPTPSPTAPTP